MRASTVVTILVSVTCCWLLSAGPGLSAARADDVYFDAAAYDWSGGRIEQRAIVVYDNRSGGEAVYVGEVAMTSADWSDTSMDGLLWSSPWTGLIEHPDPVVIGDIRWTMTTEWFTPGSRPYPACQPLAMWQDLTDEFNCGELHGYVAPGAYWLVSPRTTGAFFHSPATCELAGQQYADSDEMPSFDGLGAIPEPVSGLLLALAAPILLARRRRQVLPR